MAGQMRENAARNAMRNFGFDERVINEAIKEAKELYGGVVDAWSLIEDDGYNGLLNRCLVKQEERNMQVELEEEEQVYHDFALSQEHETQVPDALSAPREEEVAMDTSPEPLGVDDLGFHHPVQAPEWVSDVEVMEQEEGGNGVAVEQDEIDVEVDDEMIQHTPEPDELDELLREIHRRTGKSD